MLQRSKGGSLEKKAGLGEISWSEPGAKNLRESRLQEESVIPGRGLSRAEGLCDPKGGHLREDLPYPGSSWRLEKSSYPGPGVFIRQLNGAAEWPGLLQHADS